VIVDCWAWRLDSQLDGTADGLRPERPGARPIRATTGKDPFVDFTAPEMRLCGQVWDFIYGGGPISSTAPVGSLPHLDAALPADPRPGSKSLVTFLGRNLPNGEPTSLSVQGRPRKRSAGRSSPRRPSAAGTLRGGEAIRPAQSWLDGMSYRRRPRKAVRTRSSSASRTDRRRRRTRAHDRRDSAQEVPSRARSPGRSPDRRRRLLPVPRPEG